MALLELQTDPSPRDLRRFGLWLLLFAPVVTGVLYWRLGRIEPAAWAGAGVAGLALLHFAVPPARRWIFLGWTYLTYPIGWLVSATLLAVTYYGVLTPVGLLMRLFGRDPMQRRWDRDAETYWQRRGRARPKSSYFRQF